MPEPTQGRPDQRYLYEIAANLYAYASPTTLPAPEPSEPENVLLHKIAQAVYGIYGGTPPPAPCTDNSYLSNIAQNLTALTPFTVGQGRPDQVYAFIVASQLYAYGGSHGFPLAVAAPNQGDPINRLYYKIASLTLEL